MRCPLSLVSRTRIKLFRVSVGIIHVIRWVLSRGFQAGHSGAKSAGEPIAEEFKFPHGIRRELKCNPFLPVSVPIPQGE